MMLLKRSVEKRTAKARRNAAAKGAAVARGYAQLAFIKQNYIIWPIEGGNIYF